MAEVVLVAVVVVLRMHTRPTWSLMQVQAQVPDSLLMKADVDERIE